MFLIPYLFATTHPVLIAAAVLPAVILMLYVYRSDRLEKEPRSLLWRLVGMGILATLLALAGEWGGMRLLGGMDRSCLLYQILSNFLIIGLCEEGSKYLLLNRLTWRNPSFDCRYDGIVYSVFLSLGFALWENIFYVVQYGLPTALVRALTAVPGHAAFGVFMGAWYSQAKYMEYVGNVRRCRFYRVLALLIPAGLHGVYDFIALRESDGETATLFLGFIVVMFIAAFLTLRRMAKHDRYL